MEPAQEIEPELEEAALRESDGPEPEQEPEREARLAELEARLADIQEELELAKAELAVQWTRRYIPFMSPYTLLTTSWARVGVAGASSP
eukprot:SAG31_NODE_252_length_19068_cov_18.307713_11_plen_89_part_00